MPLLDSSVRLYRELIDLIVKTPQNIRYDTLDFFAKRHGLSYDWVKKRAEVLAYATEKESLRKVPKSIRQDVSNVRDEIESGRISPAEAREASKIFLSKTPLIDLERMNRTYKTEDKEILGMQTRIAQNAETLVKRMIKDGVHPVRAYSLAWSLTGRKLNYEIPKALERVPKDKLPEVIKNIWHVNFLKSQASVHYETAKLDYLNLLRSFKGKARAPTPEEIKGPYMPLSMVQFLGRRNVPKDLESFERRLESDRKSVQRFPRPGVERPFPRDIKRIAIDEHKFYASKDTSKIKDPLQRTLLDLGRRLYAADKTYRDAKQLEQEKVSPFVQISRIKRRRFRA
jgi:hypothetical protein